jgi:hypothetical protein
MRWVIVACLLVSRLASAHQTSVKYVDIAVDGAAADITFRLAPTDVTEIRDVAPTVAGWLQLASWGEPCKAGPPVSRPDEDGKLLAVTWHVTCARAPDEADFTQFFAVDQKHVAFVHVTPSELAVYVGASDPKQSLRDPPTLLAWIHGGIDHIVAWDGRDHISFVLALLLVVMLARDGATWKVRPLGPTLRSTATVITAFTIAHSLSLISAALGWVHLPSRLVESLIAVSIAYTAAENIVRPDVRWRFILTFCFGLVHGLGFASTLAVQLPPRDVIVPLLCFNVGVEIGQLMIVLIALPVFFVIAQQLGADRYRRRLMPVISGAIFIAGIVWVVKRAFLT